MRACRFAFALLVMTVAACTRTLPNHSRAERATSAASALSDTITCRDTAWSAILAAVDTYCAGTADADIEARAMDCSTMRSVMGGECNAVHRRDETFDLVAPDFEVRFRVDDRGTWSVDRVLAGF